MRHTHAQVPTSTTDRAIEGGVLVLELELEVLIGRAEIVIVCGCRFSGAGGWCRWLFRNTEEA